MDNAQSKKIIKDTFENKFEKSRFIKFIIELLNLNTEKVSEAYTSYNISYIPSIYQPYINAFEKIATYEQDGSKLDVLVIKLNKESSVERARTMQRNFIAWYLKGDCDGEQRDAALAAFVSPDEHDWRFSLIKMDYSLKEDDRGKVKIAEQFSPAKRWSFLVGADERSHTAQAQLLDVVSRDDKDITLGQLEEAFSVEKVTKEFFKKYRELFYRTNEALEEILNKDSRIRAEFEEKNIKTSDFSKKLLGQIVFLYFLQKKGWFGVGIDKDWGSGPKDFIRRLCDKKHNSPYENFFNDILEPLFYEALRKDRSEVDGYYSRFNCKIPFLNGGLFDPINDYRWEITDIFLPNELFSNRNITKEGDLGDGILDIFDRYNFTVQEDEPLEKEVAVDPEMLGKVFENLLEIKDRKSKGTYYTPREIVHYMCQQSLISYLTTELESEVRKEDIESLIHYGENIGEDADSAKKLKTDISIEIIKNTSIIDAKLESVKVCDPAVGSGAFLVGMMSEIVRVRNVLSKYSEEKNRSIYDFKRGCIEKNLYGVDIDPGAVEICKLRLWLSLIVDEVDIRNIKPLPNLDYKIVCGNSLLGVDINLLNQESFNQLEKLKPLYFSETNVNKKKEYKKNIDISIDKVTNNHKEFDFEIYFSEVFHENKGFDIIIANPPYLGESGHKEIFRELKKGKLGKFYNGKMDIFYFFFHLALNLGRDNSFISFITTNYYLTAMGAQRLRSDFKDRGILIKIINFNELKIFKSAKGQHNMVTILRKGHNDESIVKTCITKRIGSATSLILSKIMSWQDDQTDYFRIKQKDLYDVDENYIRLSGNSSGSLDKTKMILDKIKKNNQTLGSIVNINQGIVSGCDYVSSRNIKKLKLKNNIELNDGIFIFNLDNQRDLQTISKFNYEEKKLLRQFFKNSDIKRYWCKLKPSKLLLYLGKNHKNIDKYPNIKSHLNNFFEILTDRREVINNRIKYFQLQWYRIENIFTEEKIVVPYRSKKNIFAYNYCEWFCRSDSYVITIKDGEISLKYLLALLNSKLYYLWLYYKGKRKGEILELFQIPLSEIPIKKINKNGQEFFINIVNKILKITAKPNYNQENPPQEQLDLEKQIDKKVYKLYDLTPEEIELVENASKN